MDIKVLKTDDQHEKALKRIEEIFYAPVNSMEGDEADLLSILIANTRMNITLLKLKIL